MIALRARVATREAASSASASSRVSSPASAAARSAGRVRVVRRPAGRRRTATAPPSRLPTAGSRRRRRPGCAPAGRSCPPGGGWRPPPAAGRVRRRPGQQRPGQLGDRRRRLGGLPVIGARQRLVHELHIRVGAVPELAAAEPAHRDHRQGGGSSPQRAVVWRVAASTADCRVAAATAVRACPTSSTSSRPNAEHAHAADRTAGWPSTGRSAATPAPQHVVALHRPPVSQPGGAMGWCRAGQPGRPPARPAPSAPTNRTRTPTSAGARDPTIARAQPSTTAPAPRSG